MDSFERFRIAAAERLRLLKSDLEEIVPPDCLERLEVAGTVPAKYTVVPGPIAKGNELLANAGPRPRQAYNKYVLLKCIADFSLSHSRYRLPDSVTFLYERELSRILRQADSVRGAYFAIGNDSFLKDLAIVTHRLIPVGAEFAEGEGGIPRGVALAGGAGQCLRFLRFLLFRSGGRRPFFALHMHRLVLDDFDAEGWKVTYHRLAELLELNPDLKGWLSSSWFLDPALETISPHLAHLREVPLEGGAELFFVSKNPKGDSGALARSPTRQRLFAAGKYVPAIYMRVWLRRDAIAWSRRHRNGNATSGA